VHIVEENAARKALDDAEAKWAGAYDAWEAATWVVMHDPFVGIPVTESGKTRSYTYEGAAANNNYFVRIARRYNGDP
jgi:hypothetical protein